MGENVVFPVIFDTCDVMYNLSISLLPPIVLDNIFAVNVISRMQCPIYNGIPFKVGRRWTPTFECARWERLHCRFYFCT